MKIGLFIPCFMNELYPDICKSTYKILKQQGLDIDYPLNQTCCGQPMANSGCSKDIEVLAKQFVKIFKDYDYIVAPSGSCVTMVKEHYAPFFDNDKDYNKVKASIYEVCEFLHDVIKLENLSFNSSFPYKVGVHNSCHGHRALKLATASELNIPYDSKLKNLLQKVDGIELINLRREDECCGFGGTFAVQEEDISVAMGKDRIKDHLDSEAVVMTGADMSCLMHMDGIINRNNHPIKVKHIVQILLGEEL
ncbi:(Fe-S)-binding protein [Poseidonibacter antarcticus]|uniref:(Fe-S)-binding protein n=1 Tax=Poseidonibacter antarcticus TaxID=2478538 RepID=UPI000EF502E5|nr:(Fe-S)-binding protein [Poseidonibacter antarcticus]